ncbi:MAG: hypothetical protein OCD76_09720 [Reichenbachiella sp.]
MKKIILSAFLSVMLLTACDEEDPIIIPDVPVVSVDQTALDFGSLDKDEISEAKAIVISGEFLTVAVVVASPEGFEISSTETEGFGTENISIAADDLAEAGVTIYVRAAPASGFEGAMAGDLTINSDGVDEVKVSLSATVALVITGNLFMSEFFEQYADYSTTMPLDSGIMGWDLNTDTLMNFANSGGGYPEVTVANNEVMNTWYLPVPLNGATLKASLGLSVSSDLSITGYPTVAGAKNIVLDPEDESQTFAFINKKNGACVTPSSARNTSAGRRFRADNDSTDLFMSALINVETLGLAIEGKPDDFGMGDIIALANATSGPSNNNTIKVVALTDGVGGMQFGLLKENEGNSAVLSEAIFALNTTYAIVLSHDFVEGANNDVSKLYVFAEGDEIPTSMAGLTPAVTMDATYTEGVDPTDLSIVYMRERRQSVITPVASVTGIRVGDTWLATLFEEHANAQNSNDITLNDRVLVNEGITCPE